MFLRAFLAGLGALLLLGVASATHFTEHPDAEDRAFCMDGMSATANADGSVTLTWPGHPATDYPIFAVYRSSAGTGPMDFLGFVNATGAESYTYTDATTEPGVAYHYKVRGEAGPHDGVKQPFCADVTAVPFFGAPLLGALAVAGSVLAFALLRRG